jgi:hypothetical protein
MFAPATVADVQPSLEPLEKAIWPKAILFSTLK